MCSPQVRSSAGVRAMCSAEPGMRSCSRSAVATGCPGSPSHARISVGVRIWAMLLRWGQVRRRRAAHDGRQQRLVDVHRPDGRLGEHRRAGLRPHSAHERLLAVPLDEQRAGAVHAGLCSAASPGRRRAGEHEPVEAVRGEQHRVQERRGPHRRADAAHRAVGAQDVEQGEQIAGEIRPHVVALGLLAAGPTVPARVVTDHPVSRPRQGTGVERSRRVVRGPAAGEAVQADDERTGARVVVGDPSTAYKGVHGGHSVRM